MPLTHLRTDPDLLREYSKRPEVRAASYPLGECALRARRTRGGLDIVPASVFHGRRRSLAGVSLILAVALGGLLTTGVEKAGLPILAAIIGGLVLMFSDKPPFFSGERAFASLRGGFLRYRSLDWRTEVIGGLVILESFEHPGFHCITHLVVDTDGRPLFCLAQLRRECGKTNLPTAYLRLLGRELGVGVRRIRPGVEGDDIELLGESASATARPTVEPSPFGEPDISEPRMSAPVSREMQSA